MTRLAAVGRSMRSVLSGLAFAAANTFVMLPVVAMVAEAQNASPLPPKPPPIGAQAQAAQGSASSSAQSLPSSQSLANPAVAAGKAPAAGGGDRQDRQGDRRRQMRLFPPERLGELEGPDRELWQKPDQIMDALGIADGSIVADLGAGGGWFTVRLARRVGPHGIVYAEDVQEQMIESIQRRMQREGLRNVRTVLGTETDPKLPRKVEAMLIVDSFYEVRNPVALLQKIREQLLPNGRLGIAEFRKDGGGPGPPLEERVEESVVLANAEAAGLRLIARETFLPYMYLLVFGRNEAATPSTSTGQGRE